ncbi:MAG: hypothetical protein A3I20_02100 [Candidatus Portnoybacteria bacterium RIFCSPLOWO2_02_FULL_40_15]|uniref:YoaR-like putative peptidoglycan binding domain-containing protein n=1 Tax=Candidatus Portnoybacteria bacterium RIFCSPLOWO2_02_FULL_40_15 TaxID=1802002 RepID=A0A1G2FQC3_9BACT|nr:MAG: hypothetical protein A3I20_02100 [Candidatus Portnoybacteria bacterium RIFCSPLOWO2_02_FULL_40_15]
MEINQRKIFVVLITIFLSLAVFLLALEAANASRIVRGVKAANLKLGGLKFNQAERILDSKIEKWQENDLTFKNGNEKWQSTLKELGIEIEKDKTLKQAFQIGRDKNILIGLNQQIRALFGKYNLPLGFKIEEPRFSDFLNNQFKGIEKPARNADLVYNQTKADFDLIPGETGLVVDKQKIKEDLAKRINSFSSPLIELSLIEEKPKITNEEALKTRQEVSMILRDAPYQLKHNNKNWPINKETLLDWLSLKPKENNLEIILNQEKIEEYLTNLAPSINQSAANVRLTATSTDPLIGEPVKQVVVLTPSKNRIELKIKENALLITKTILNQPAAGQKEIQLLTELSPALVDIKNLDELGITHLLSQGTSDFSGSPKNRVHNIKIGAAKFDGALIKPGEEFSFNEILGEIGPQQGYLAELVIKKGKTIPEYGGGLCQVSTTMFRAAVNAGLKITERFPHSFPVRYYNPQGFDATIYPPHPDLRFINDTPNNILIQSKIEGNHLSFEFFGTDDGRKTEILGPYVFDKKEDGSMKASLTQKVYKNGELLREKTFYSNYKSPALYPVERNPLE